MMDLQDRFDTSSPLVGMVHLPALPGAPRSTGSRRNLRGRALADALAIAESGFDGILVENYGDTPYYPEAVPKHVVAELTATVRELDIAIERPIGVNVLRNDATAALSVAGAAGGGFIRVNVHTGVRDTDQGRIEGQAHDTLRLRDRIDADVDILADVAVKHSGSVSDRPLAAVVTETIERGLADGIVVTGPSTGDPADSEDLLATLDARDDSSRDPPVFAGSGVTPDNVRDTLELADGAIVGTAIKEKGVTANPVDIDRAADVVTAVYGE